MKILEDNPKPFLATAYIALLVGATALGFTVVPRGAHPATSPCSAARFLSEGTPITHVSDR
jgi:hypothetical protein